MGPFNPFTARNKNTRVRWFENELSKFYTYVESQPLLTHDQELQYGKALNMWMRVLNLRDQTLVPLLNLHDLHSKLLLGGRETLDLLLEPLQLGILEF